MASSSSSNRVRNYDVFLSFRGEDTRHNIVSYLYEALCRDGIFTFRDDNRLRKGDKISDQLVEAIKTSWFAVVVISKNYATSKWCLDELQLIMELHGKNRIQVVPIFYGVDPSNVRHQTGSFEAAFQEYRDLDMPSERVLQWRRALKKIGHLAGFHSTTSLDEAAMISNTVRSISRQLMKMRPTNGLDLVGMDAHMVKMHFLLNMGSESEVLIIGIWGMGGVGKTTIAEHLYDRFSRQFPAHYFIKDIKKIYKDKSPSYLQEIFLLRILSGQHFGFRSEEAGSQEIKARLGHQKVFVVLDGVDKIEQIHALAKETSWFFPGSRIIITTRDKGLLNACGVNNVYKVKCLDDKDALQVFEKFAFGGRPPPSDVFEQFYIKASQLAHGLPSALVAYASYLSENKTTEGWENKLRILEKFPPQNVEKILRTSYDGLDNQDKMAFLHVACLLNGYPFNHVSSLLEDGRPRMDQLIAKSLISISTDGCVNMHFLVAQTGREIVRLQSKNRPSRQRFLWDHKEIYVVLESNIGTDETEGVKLHMCEMPDKLLMNMTVFNVMKSIKFLKFFRHLGGAESNVELMQDGLNFPPNLRLLHWDVYPLKTLPSNFRPNQLVELNLRYSKLVSLWDTNVSLPNLRRLDVTCSKNLIELPDFSTANRLDELIVDGCMKLQIPNSLYSLRFNSLTKFNAIQCDILKGVHFIAYLNWDCSGDASQTIIAYLYIVFSGTTPQTSIAFPDEVVIFNCLTDLSIEGQIYIQLSTYRSHSSSVWWEEEQLSTYHSHSLSLLGQAQHLSFGSKQHIPDQSITMEQESVRPQLMYDANSSKSLEIKQFRYMKDRHPFHCSSFKIFASLTELKLINLNIQDIPDDIMDLTLLEKLDLDGNDFVHLPLTMWQVPKLKYLSLGNCRILETLPRLAQVETLILSDCINLRSLMRNDFLEEQAKFYLLELWVDNCKNVQNLSEQLSHFTKLTYLDLSRHDFVTVPSSIKELSSLGTLFLNNCKKLKSIEDLPLSLKHLYAHGCDSLENVTLSPNHSIKHLDVIHCPRLNREKHEHLVNLFIYDGQSQERCVCIQEAGMSSDSDYTPIVTPAKINRVKKLFRSFKSVFRRR